MAHPTLLAAPTVDMELCAPSGTNLTPMEPTIAVLGLGYVGLPLAIAFTDHFDVIGFDIDSDRVDQLERGHDHTREVDGHRLRDVTFSSDPADLRRASVFIIAVPTPIDVHKRPDLEPLLTASRAVGAAMHPGDLVIYESTVYPGCTEEDCIPVLEAASSMQVNQGFAVGYSPERINPGDRNRRLADVIKVVSGSSPEAEERVAALYSRIVSAGIHRAPSIRVAEAAKVIENTQRDVNIALVNELALLFNRLGLDTGEVLAAAGTKWNFLPFRPGLVGGHCIGVDPYYLTHKAIEVGHYPEVILAGRRINDSMGTYVADQLVLLMTRSGLQVGGSRVLVLGLAFKENCPDTKNTRVADIVSRLREYRVVVAVADPWVEAEQAKDLGVDLVPLEQALEEEFTAAVLAVAHDQFIGIAPALRRLVGTDGILYDVKGLLGPEADARL
jgi:UDP-N-acetyl-D-glucosamine/UDP-N-acetyl-D-galactosamine dehydrogenase